MNNAEKAWSQFFDSWKNVSRYLTEEVSRDIVGVLREEYGSSSGFISVELLFLHLPSIYRKQNHTLHLTNNMHRTLTLIENDMQNHLDFKLSSLDDKEIIQVLHKNAKKQLDMMTFGNSIAKGTIEYDNNFGEN